MSRQYRLMGIGLILVTALNTISINPVFADNQIQSSIPVVIHNENTGLQQFQVGLSAYREVVPTAELSTPLGSLWKLFVYLYLTGEKIYPPPYYCHGREVDEAFCCLEGGAIQMDKALIQSCGLYFNFDRLKIDPHRWEKFWKTNIGVNYDWLIQLSQQVPATSVPVFELLQALSTIQHHPEIYRKAVNVLSQVVIYGTAKGAFRHVGSLLNIKTFTWDDPKDPHKMIGGFAGWLSNGTAIWTMGSGTSKQFMDQWSVALQPILEQGLLNTAEECVRVNFFSRYPIIKIVDHKTGKDASPGLLGGKYRVEFANGNHLNFKSDRQIRYHLINSKKTLSGIFNINDYVARVLDREAAFDPPEAAKAFAIIMRTYLLQNGRKTGDCFRIDDSTRYQRVSINPPSAASRRLSYWTGNLVLQGAGAVYYHGNQLSSNTLSWEFAKKMAASGFFFDQILASVYKQHRIGNIESGEALRCHRLKAAEDWLKVQSILWSEKLSTINGYQKPDDVQVCKLDHGIAFSDLGQNKIYVTAMTNTEDKIAVAHEYLHLCFKTHPLTMDEFFIEKTARRLIQAKMGTYETF